jgi:hypothetical protein
MTPAPGPRSSRVLRTLAAVAVVGLAAAVGACGSTGGGAVPGATRSLTPELFPMEPRSAEYVFSSGERRTVRLAPEPAGGTLWIEGGSVPMKLDVRRTANGIAFHGDLDSGTELLRFGALPGDSWESGDAEVRFEGWERLELPGGPFDAARVRTTVTVRDVRQEETWWFAAGLGILRLRSDYGGIFSEEMVLAR